MSIFDVEYNSYDDSIIIKRWLDENCNIYGDSYPEPIEIINNIVNVKGTVSIKNKMIEYIPIQFGIVSGGFNCSGCIHLKSLKGCPKQSKWFDCYWCSSLTNLDGGPQIVSEQYDCSECMKLKSLKGGPIRCGKFVCSHCPLLIDMNLSTSSIGDFDCSSCISLKSLNGLPDIINGDLKCCNCRSLEDMVGFPKRINGDMNCSICDKLSSINGIPTIITGDVLLSRCRSLIVSEPEIRNKSIIKGEVYI